MSDRQYSIHIEYNGEKREHAIYPKSDAPADIARAVMARVMYVPSTDFYKFGPLGFQVGDERTVIGLTNKITADNISEIRKALAYDVWNDADVDTTIADLKANADVENTRTTRTAEDEGYVVVQIIPAESVAEGKTDAYQVFRDYVTKATRDEELEAQDFRLPVVTESAVEFRTAQVLHFVQNIKVKGKWVIGPDVDNVTDVNAVDGLAIDLNEEGADAKLLSLFVDGYNKIDQKFTIELKSEDELGAVSTTTVEANTDEFDDRHEPVITLGEIATPEPGKKVVKATLTITKGNERLGIPPLTITFTHPLGEGPTYLKMDETAPATGGETTGTEATGGTENTGTTGTETTGDTSSQGNGETGTGAESTEGTGAETTDDEEGDTETTTGPATGETTGGTESTQPPAKPTRYLAVRTANNPRNSSFLEYGDVDSSVNTGELDVFYEAETGHVMVTKLNGTDTPLSVSLVVVESQSEEYEDAFDKVTAGKPGVAVQRMPVSQDEEFMASFEGETSLALLFVAPETSTQDAVVKADADGDKSTTPSAPSESGSVDAKEDKDGQENGNDGEENSSPSNPSQNDGDTSTEPKDDTGDQPPTDNEQPDTGSEEEPPANGDTTEQPPEDGEDTEQVPPTDGETGDGKEQGDGTSDTSGEETPPGNTDTQTDPATGEQDGGETEKENPPADVGTIEGTQTTYEEPKETDGIVTVPIQNSNGEIVETSIDITEVRKTDPNIIPVGIIDNKPSFDTVPVGTTTGPVITGRAGFVDGTRGILNTEGALIGYYVPEESRPDPKPDTTPRTSGSFSGGTPVVGTGPEVPLPEEQPVRRTSPLARIEEVRLEGYYYGIPFYNRSFNSSGTDAVAIKPVRTNPIGEPVSGLYTFKTPDGKDAFTSNNPEFLSQLTQNPKVMDPATTFNVRVRELPGEDKFFFHGWSEQLEKLNTVPYYQAEMISLPTAGLPDDIQMMADNIDAMYIELSDRPVNAIYSSHSSTLGQANDTVLTADFNNPVVTGDVTVTRYTRNRSVDNNTLYNVQYGSVTEKDYVEKRTSTPIEMAAWTNQGTSKKTIYHGKAPIATVYDHSAGDRPLEEIYVVEKDGFDTKYVFVKYTYNETAKGYIESLTSDYTYRDFRDNGVERVYESVIPAFNVYEPISQEGFQFQPENLDVEYYEVKKSGERVLIGKVEEVKDGQLTNFIRTNKEALTKYILAKHYQDDTAYFEAKIVKFEGKNGKTLDDLSTNVMAYALPAGTALPSADERLNGITSNPFEKKAEEVTDTVVDTQLNVAVEDSEMEDVLIGSSLVGGEMSSEAVITSLYRYNTTVGSPFLEFGLGGWN